MTRPVYRNTELNLDYLYGIKKLCNGNMRRFYDEWIRGKIPCLEFYIATKPMEPINKDVEQVVEEAYFEALGSFGLTHEDLAMMPTFTDFLQNLNRSLESYMVDEREFNTQAFMQDTRQKIRFYLRLFEEGTMKLEKGKKSKIV